MRHTVEIADSQGKTMRIAVSTETFGRGGSWRSLDKGMINHNSGPIGQDKPNWGTTLDVFLMQADKKYYGIELREFISWGTVNDEGTGTLVQPWVLALTPGEIEWSIV